MDKIGPVVKERFEQIIIENEMLKAGFAAVPYAVLRDSDLKPGPKVTYAVLLMYAWQEGSTFAGQETLAKDVGVSVRQVRTYLYELQNFGYILIEHRGLNKPNLYRILDVRTKLKAKNSRRTGSTLPVKTGNRLPTKVGTTVPTNRLT